MITLAELRRELSAAGDADRARSQQAYMKSEMPYHGVTLPELRKLLRPHLRDVAALSRDEWEREVRHWWDDAGHREERYAALALARAPAARDWHDRDSLDLDRHLVVSGAWWDVVDETAQHLVGAALLRDRSRVTPVVRAWASDDDLWLRRTAVICQLDHRGDTDLELLTHAIERNVDDTSFWLRKAIGWALRQHARTDPDWVRSYVDGLGDRLSGLSRREATKHLAAAP